MNSSSKKRGYIKSKGNENPLKCKVQSLIGGSRKGPMIEKKKESGAHIICQIYKRAFWRGLPSYRDKSYLFYIFFDRLNVRVS